MHNRFVMSTTGHATALVVALLSMLFLLTTLRTAAAADLKALYVSNIVMADGVRLAADIYLPQVAGPHPAILVRTPYDPRIKPPIDFPKKLALAGYAVVINHCRGRYDSGGDFVPFKQEGSDGCQVVDWIAKQSWCNGDVGLIGASYSGMAAWQLAAKGNQHVKAIFVIVAPADLYRNMMYPGGAFALETNFWWFSLVDRRTVQDWSFNDWEAALKHLPVLTIDVQLGRKLPLLREMMAHPSYGSYWKQFYSMDDLYDHICVPAFIVGGWNDPLVGGSLETFAGMRRSNYCRQDPDARVQALIGPWDHMGAITGIGTNYGDIDYGKDASVDVTALAQAWFDKWLKGKELVGWQRQPLRYFLTGDNQWLECLEWPPRNSHDEVLYLHSDGKANSIAGSGRLTKDAPGLEESDSFLFNPATPVTPPASKHILTNSAVKDVSTIESRSDVLVYTSDKLTADLTVVGKPRLVLNVSSTLPDTDFTAWLTDVSADGRSMSLLDAVVRCSQQPAAKCQTFVAGDRCKITIELGSLAHLFKSGHSLRIDVSSSNSPAFDCNLGTGGDNWLATEGRAAHQVVMHNSQALSQLLLPVIR